MAKRERLASIAMTLTVTDVVVFERWFAAIWQVWSGTFWIRLLLVFLLAVWVASATVVWLHAWFALRPIVRRVWPILSQEPATSRDRQEGDGDV